MVLLARNILIFMACWAVAGAGKKQKDNILDFMSVFQGIWNNKAQIAKGEKVPLFQKRIVPVDIPALCQEPVVFVEIERNNTIISFELAVITEDTDNTLYLTMYNFTDRPEKFGTHNLSSLAKIQRKDLSHSDGCVAKFEFAAKGVYVGSWSDCILVVNGVHPSFSQMYSCDYHLSFPLMFSESRTGTAFRNNRFGPRLPVINAPDDYVGPCEKTY